LWLLRLDSATAATNSATEADAESSRAARLEDGS
jgi:hypothetical protein